MRKYFIGVVIIALTLIIFLAPFTPTLGSLRKPSINFLKGYSLVIDPKKIQLEPLQTKQLQIHLEKKNTETQPTQSEYLVWEVVNGGGIINQDGLFQAWDLPGKYKKTIKVTYYDLTQFVDVKIVLGDEEDEETDDEEEEQREEDNEDRRERLGDGDDEDEEDKDKKVSTPTITIPPTITPTISASPSPTTTLQPEADRPLDETPTPTPTVEAAPMVDKTSPTPSPTTQLIALTPTTQPPTELEEIQTKEEFQEETPEEQQPLQSDFNYTDEPALTCLKEVFGSTDYQKYFDPNGTRLDPLQLGARLSAADRCLKINRVTDYNKEVKVCLIQALGSDRYREIAETNKTPTINELKVASFCFTKPQVIAYKPTDQIEPLILTCLQIKLGKEHLEKILESQNTPNQEDLLGGRECFNIEESTTPPPLKLKLPDHVDRCLKESLGDARYFQIYAENKSSTKKESEKANSCFRSIEITQRTFLPPPSEEIPFIPKSKKDVAIKGIKALSRQTRTTLQFSGKAPPNSIVDIYIFSTPIIVTAKSDANGDWFYELIYHLPEGEHKAYSVVSHPENGKVKSEVLTFSVAFARETSDKVTPELIVVQQPSEQFNRTYIYALIGLITTGLVVVVGLLIIELRKQQRFNQNTNAIPPESSGSDPLKPPSS